MRCTACGATNPDGAQWCGQCFGQLGPLREPDPPPGAPDTPDTLPAPADTHPAPADEPDPRTAGAPVSAGGLRRTGDDIEWECVRCREFNQVERMTCRVCGAGFADRYRTAEPERTVNWPAALALSIVVPGSGHLLAGRTGSGVSRVILFTIWLLGGAAIMAGDGGSPVVAAPLLLGVLLVWGGTAVDVLNLQNGRPELLAGRTLLWLVVGVTALMLLAMVVAAMGAAPGAGPPAAP